MIALNLSDTEHKRLLEITQLLRDHRGQNDPDFWVWLIPGVKPTRKSANKFMLASILDYQMKAETVWANARRFAEETLGDPEWLWNEITATSLETWNRCWKQHKLHRFPKAHERVWTIGNKIVSEYGGDARAIWQSGQLNPTMIALKWLGAGEQISRMIAGALFDTGLITGSGDVKADIHVKRVLGRAVMGAKAGYVDPNEAIRITQVMFPENPWLLDRPVFELGKSLCSAERPTCNLCYLRPVCRYAGRG